MRLSKEQLEELRRKARDANEQFDVWGSNAAPDWHGNRLHPRVVLALLDRIEELEKYEALVLQQAAKAREAK